MYTHTYILICMHAQPKRMHTKMPIADISGKLIWNYIRKEEKKTLCFLILIFILLNFNLQNVWLVQKNVTISFIKHKSNHFLPLLCHLYNTFLPIMWFQPTNTLRRRKGKCCYSSFMSKYKPRKSSDLPKVTPVSKRPPNSMPKVMILNQLL